MKTYVHLLLYIYIYISIVFRKYFRQELGRKSGQVLPSIIFSSKILLFMRKLEKKTQATSLHFHCNDG